MVCAPGFVLSGSLCVPIEAPRQIAPLSTATVSSLSPVFRWVLPAGVDGTRLQVCSDRTCVTVVHQVDFTGGATSGAVPGALSHATGVYFWRLAGRAGTATAGDYGPTWSFAVRHSSSPVTSSWGTHCDLDLDGHPDLGVGAPGSSAVHVYRGDNAVPSAIAWATLVGPAGSAFGASVVSAGDVNGDGFPELLVGAPGGDSAYLYAGSATGIATAPSMALSGMAGSGFGTSVAGAGDVNGDGFADVIVGAPAINTVYAYLGSSTGLSNAPDVTLTQLAGRFGQAVQGAGDLNADGFADVVVGWPQSASASVYMGSAWGLSSTATETLTGPPGSEFGVAISPGCDTIGSATTGSDGYTDIVVGAPGANQVFVYAGSAAGTGVAAVATLIAASGGACPSRLPVGFGAAVDCVGDVDGNGYDDVHVGADGVNVYEFRSSNVGPGVVPGWAACIPAPSGSSGFGGSIHGTGRISADAFGEFLVGAPGSDAAYLFLGDPSGLRGAIPTASFAGPAGSAFGQSVE